jgi:PPOX class probable F420-dependent enzyme
VPTTRSNLPGLSAEIRAFLEAPRYATISTVNADGSPHQAVVWYVVEGDDLLINSRRGRRWPSNLLRDPRIAVAVYEVADPNHWVGLKGSAELLREGAAAVEDIMGMARRYGKDPNEYLGQDRVTYKVRITSTYEYGD